MQNSDEFYTNTKNLFLAVMSTKERLFMIILVSVLSYT